MALHMEKCDSGDYDYFDYSYLPAILQIYLSVGSFLFYIQ